ncbi:hypothetical protein HT136_07100 [Novosphingobium profundi]|uniref:hypothetical protein n=1 Tax=Novosphingobium profundi TaxID=1774954 RepID=UPI001BDA2F9E|nr:hypothetical protein [Novosphingobium profundi]MBT0668130.1 hypothetical protein [Novosphingobium profundi]
MYRKIFNFAVSLIIFVCALPANAQSGSITLGSIPATSTQSAALTLTMSFDGFMGNGYDDEIEYNVTQNDPLVGGSEREGAIFDDPGAVILIYRTFVHGNFHVMLGTGNSDMTDYLNENLCPEQGLIAAGGGNYWDCTTIVY